MNLASFFKKDIVKHYKFQDGVWAHMLYRAKLKGVLQNSSVVFL